MMMTVTHDGSLFTMITDKLRDDRRLEMLLLYDSYLALGVVSDVARG